MIPRGAARFRIQRAILFLKRFTVDQLVEATELEPDIVQRTIHRFVAEGFISKLGDVVRTSGRGRPRQLYSLTNDEGKLRELREDVANFRVSAPEVSPWREPESPHYWRALEILEDLEHHGGSPVARELEEPERALALARRYEAMLNDGVDGTTPYLDLAEGRLKLLTGDAIAAERLLSKARAAFDAAGIVNRVREAAEYAAAASLSQVPPDANDAATGSTGGYAEALRRIADVLNEVVATPPLTAAIRKTLDAAAHALEPHAEWLRGDERHASTEPGYVNALIVEPHAGRHSERGFRSVSPGTAIDLILPENRAEELGGYVAGAKYLRRRTRRDVGCRFRWTISPSTGTLARSLLFREQRPEAQHILELHERLLRDLGLTSATDQGATDWVQHLLALIEENRRARTRLVRKAPADLTEVVRMIDGVSGGEVGAGWRPLRVESTLNLTRPHSRRHRVGPIARVVVPQGGALDVQGPLERSRSPLR